jgi:hypothetical protein
VAGVELAHLNQTVMVGEAAAVEAMLEMQGVAEVQAGPA